MSKSFRNKKNFSRREEHDDQEYYSQHSSYRERRERRVMNNAIRSKNIARLLELGDDDSDSDIRG